MRNRAKRAAKTTEDRAATQQQRRERQTLETEEQRKVRLQRMRITHSERMAVETEEQREARLQRIRTNQSDRLAALFSLSPFTYSHVLQHSMRSSGSPHTVPCMTLV